MGEALTQWLPDFLVYRSVSYNYVVVISTTKFLSNSNRYLKQHLWGGNMIRHVGI